MTIAIIQGDMRDVCAALPAALESCRLTLGADAPGAIGDADLVEFLEMQKFNLEPMRQRIRNLAAPAVAAGCQALIAGAVWSIVDAPEAYAAERATKFDGAIDPTTAAIAIGLTVAIIAILGLMSLLATNSRDDEPFNKPEDWGSQ